MILPHTMLEPQDDPAFLGLIDRIIANLVRLERPGEVYLVHVDNWFDHKWLKFSGYGVVPFHGGTLTYHSTIKGFHQEKLTFPPFAPNRIVAQYFFCRMRNGNYEEQAPAHLVHPTRRQRSASNLHRRVADFSMSALFLWYSSGSTANGKGSMLVYGVRKEELTMWYAGFTRGKRWNLDRVKGVSRQEVETLS
jgi:hypothetical protein